MGLIFIKVEEVKIRFIYCDLSTGCCVVEVGLCRIRHLLCMNFTVRTDGNGHFNHVLKDFVGFTCVNEVMGNGEDSIITHNNTRSGLNHSIGKFRTNENHIATDGTCHVDFS